MNQYTVLDNGTIMDSAFLAVCLDSIKNKNPALCKDSVSRRA